MISKLEPSASNRGVKYAATSANAQPQGEDGPPAWGGKKSQSPGSARRYWWVPAEYGLSGTEDETASKWSVKPGREGRLRDGLWPQLLSGGTPLRHCNLLPICIRQNFFPFPTPKQAQNLHLPAISVEGVVLPSVQRSFRFHFRRLMVRQNDAQGIFKHVPPVDVDKTPRHATENGGFVNGRPGEICNSSFMCSNHRINERVRGG